MYLSTGVSTVAAFSALISHGPATVTDTILVPLVPVSLTVSLTGATLITIGAFKTPHPITPDERRDLVDDFE